MGLSGRCHRLGRLESELEELKDDVSSLSPEEPSLESPSAVGSFPFEMIEGLRIMTSADIAS